jgi:hypothetical protein
LGNHASTRLAFEIASRVSRQAALRGAYRAGLQSSNDPSKVVAAASQVISSIMARQCASLPNDKASSSEDEAIIKSVVSASNRVLTKVVDEIDRLSANSSFDVAKLDQAIKLECTALAAEFLGRPSGGNVALSPDLEAGVRQTLDEANIDLLQCGHDRRTLVFVPRTDPECNLIRDLATVRPEIATIPASVDEAIVFCEGSGISSTAFLQGLERVYPDIAEAASRFFTRIDINWRARRS